MTKNSSAESAVRALRMAGSAKTVVPISESSTNRMRRGGPASRAISRSMSHVITVAMAHSGTPASRSMRRMVSIFIVRF